MTQPRGGLGRGLSALLPKETTTPGGGGGVREIPVNEIRPNPRQPRKEFDENGIEELAASIKAVGVLQPISVRRTETGYELIMGERRLRASRRAGLETVPAIIREIDDSAMLRDALIENLQRVDLNPLEEAAAYRQLIDDLGVTHEELASRVGKSRAAITNSLRLLALAPEVQERIASGALTAAHGRAIAAIADQIAQARAATRAVAEGLTVRETEEMVRRLAASGVTSITPRGQASRAVPPAGILEAEARLSDALDTRVRIQGGRRRGKIVIEYAGQEDLARIVKVVTESPHAPRY